MGYERRPPRARTLAVGLFEGRRLLVGGGPRTTLVQPEIPVVRSTQSAAKLARKHGIDLLKGRGSGVGGQVTREDVRHVLKARGIDEP